jgi:plastocyanin
MRKAVLCVMVALLGVGAASCGNDKKSGEAQTLKVQVDGTTAKFNAAFIRYFPQKVTVHPGDTVDFQEHWTGEPHTVTMGTLVDAGLKAVQAVPPDQRESAPPPPAYEKLPSLFPEGPGDAHQNAAQPCFLTTGEPPADPAKPCDKAQQSETPFNGKQTYYNSGFLPEGSTFKVKLAEDTAPGSYSYYCNLHGPDMSGTIDVVAKDAKAQTASEVEKAATSEKDAIVKQLEGPYNDAKAGKFPLPGIKNVAGYGADGVDNALIDEFIPAEINAKVGEKVSWALIGPHTLSFGKAPIEPGKFLTKDSAGAWHLNEQAFAPAGFPQAPQPNGPPPAQPKITPLDGGTFDGTGYKSTGFIAGGPPDILAPTLTFTKAGTYSYVCLVHPKMGGTVKVA